MARGKKPLLENIEIKKIAAEGKSIAYVEDKVLFVPNTVPGDIVDVQVTRKRKSFLEGLVTRMRQPSALRIEPRCAHFGICGGCKWQNLPYEAQLQFKQQEVIDNLERIGKAELQDIRPIIGAARQFEYRNKLEFTFSSQRFLTREEIANGAEIERTPAVGFHVPGLFDKVVDIEHCYLQGSNIVTCKAALPMKSAISSGVMPWNTGFHFIISASSTVSSARWSSAPPPRERSWSSWLSGTRIPPDGKPC